MIRVGRREFVRSGVGALGAAAVGCGRSADRSADTGGETLEFPPGFLWGAAGSAYQIEGGWNADGKGPSIWDTFVHAKPSPIWNGDTGDVACDHYHLYRDDVALMRSLNLQSYRFSISWSRVLPSGSGRVNQAGIDFYSRLVDELLAAGIRPLPTLFHFDLPQALSDAGGWASRETAWHFADYADLMVRALGDRVVTWLIFNEAIWFTLPGYWTGQIPPSLSGNFPRFLRATHISNIAQGMAFQAMKATNPALRISSAFNMTSIEPRTSSAEDQDAANRLHAFLNLWWIEPALRRQYPYAFRPFPAAEMDVRSGDMDLIRAPFDFLGINCYQRGIAAPSSPGAWGMPGFDIGYWTAGSPDTRTDNGWEIYPNALHDVLMRMREYGLPMEVTENGCAFNDGPNASGVVDDQRRIDFYKGYIAGVHRAIQEGADVRGFHAWSLMDNFEWLQGFATRLGLTYVDFKSRARTRIVKESGRWFAQLSASNRLSMS
jgi:beta-glucosidase